MSAIMRRRRSLIGLSLIEGSCPEVGVWQSSILRTGRPPGHRLSISCLARPSPLAPLRAQPIPAQAGSFDDPNLTFDRVLSCKRRSYASLALMLLFDHLV